MLCGLLLAGMALGAAPPARFTPEQVKLLRERTVLWKAGLKAWKAGKQAEAITALEQSLATNVRVCGLLDRITAIIIDRLSNWHQTRGEWAQEVKYRRMGIEARRMLYGEGHYRTVDARLELADALAQAKRTPAQRAALARARGLNQQAGSLYDKGQTAKAIPLARQALSIRKEALGEKHPYYANSLNILAMLYQSMGDHKQALPLYRKAQRISKEVLGEKHPSYAISLNNLATLYQDMGDHKQALPLCKKALEIYKEVLGEKHPSYANSLNNLVVLYVSMGDHKQALPLSKQALEIRKEVLGEKHPSYAGALHNLAFLYKDMGEYKQALPLCKKALEIYKEVLGEKHPWYATSLSNLARMYKDMGDHKAALPLYKQALEINKEALGEKHPHYAASLHNLAFLYKDMGEYKQALPLYKHALEITKEILGEKHPDYATCLSNLAFLYQNMGDYKQALPLSEEAVGLTISYLQASAAVQSDRQQLVAAEKLRHRLDGRLSLMDIGCYPHVLAWKGSVLLRQRQRRLFTALSAGPKTREAALDLQATTRQIAALSASAKPAREQLERLTQEQERLQAKLSDLSATARAAFKADAITPQALAKSLPEGAVLVDYLFYWRSGVKDKGGKPRWQRHLVAFVSRRGKPTARIDLGPADRAIEAVREWRPLLGRSLPDRRFGADVKKLIWSPLEKHLVGAKVVLISPDEALACVPFAALPGEKEGTYLVEDVALAVVPVPAMLPEMLKPVDRAKRLKPSLLVVGDVDYDRAGVVVRADKAGDRGAPLGVRRGWGKLSATAVEGLAVRASFEKLFKTGKATPLTEGEATKAKVREALANVRYAHLATHGFFAPEDIKSAAEPRASAGLFGREGVTGWHPLLLSGLVLAGANKEPKEGEEDGILTALEVSEMELPKLELVVLSACETGLGKCAGGEGLLGLQRAFAVAGARSVMASLWRVDDRATRALMSDFYAAAWDTEKVISRAEALRQAQLKMLKDGAARGGIVKLKVPKGKPAPRLPPYYWAGFVLSGDWR
jgi:CHAT domain-containing protein/Tfp pilus assembly protein PilF